MRGGCACVCACLRAGLPGNAIQAWKCYSNDDDKNTNYNNRTGQKQPQVGDIGCQIRNGEGEEEDGKTIKTFERQRKGGEEDRGRKRDDMKERIGKGKWREEAQEDWKDEKVYIILRLCHELSVVHLIKIQI